MGEVKTMFKHIEFSQWLVEHIEQEYNSSVEKFSYEADLGKSAIYHYINGDRAPTAESLAKICKALDVPYSDALSRFGPVEERRRV